MTPTATAARGSTIAATPAGPGATSPAGQDRAAAATPVATAPAPPGVSASAPATAPARAVPSNLPSSAPMTVRLAAGCVTPGGTQRVIVDTLPDAYIAYDNLYADQRDGQVHGGADGRARSDRHGHFEASWVVSATAPLGDVRLDIGASADNRATVRMLFYRLAARC